MLFICLKKNEMRLETQSTTLVTLQNNSWYMDSGATNHITTNLSLLFNYKMLEQLQVESSELLNISHANKI